MGLNIFDLAAVITLDRSAYERGLNDAERSAETKGGKIGEILGGLGKVAAAGTVAAGAAVIKLAKDATDSYASYEQLVGGVETLFGTGGKNLEEYAASVGKSVADAEGDFNNFQYAQDLVMENADKAFKTVGLSANEYMTTVTGFSASLVQSMGGDTLEAAKKADLALQDMSDNANKMGTSMGSIQYAYQGFAKQNYTMLDNLKLGYGGTKAEMERLLEDAERIKESHGEMADYSIDSYADVIDAIHTVQEEMGITGTTAKEAATTIEGSSNTMKAAWGNLVLSIAKGDDTVRSKTTEFLFSASTWLKNIVPVISRAFSGVAEFISSALSKITKVIPSIIKDLIPDAIKAVTSVIGSIIRMIPMALKGVKQTLKDLLPIFSDIIVQIGDALPLDLKKYVLPAFGSITAFLDDVFKGDWARAWEEIKNICHNAFDGVGRFFEDKFGGVRDTILSIDWVDVGEKILSAITGVLSSITSVVFDIFANVVNTITTIDWGDVGGKIFTLITYALGQIVEFAKNVFTQAKDFIAEIDWAGIAHSIVEFFTGSFESIGEGLLNIDWLGLAISILDFLKQGFSSAIEFMVTLFTDIWSVISEIDWPTLGQTIWDRIVQAFLGIWDWALTTFEEAKNAIASINWLEVGNNVWDTIISAFNNVAGWVDEKFNFMADQIREINWAQVGTDIWNWLVEAFATIGSWAGDTFRTAVEVIKGIPWAEVGQAIWDWIVGAFTSIGSWAGNTFREMVRVIKEDINWEAVGEFVWNAIKTGVGFLVKGGGKVLSWAVSFGREIVDGLKETNWEAVGQFLWDGIKAGVGFVTKGVGKVITWGINMGTEIYNGLKETNWEEVGNTLWGGIKTGFGFVKKGVGALLDWAKDLGSEIVDGIQSTNWADKGKEVWDAIKGAFSGVTDFFSGLFDFSGIHIKLPHIKVVEWGNLGPLSVPVQWDVVWEAKGYDNPLLYNSRGILGGYGFGDRGNYQGGEMVYSHDRLMDDIKEAVGGNRIGDVTINVYQQPGEDAEDLAERISRIMADDYDRRAAMLV